jgi:hypothetical protein
VSSEFRLDARNHKGGPFEDECPGENGARDIICDLAKDADTAHYCYGAIIAGNFIQHTCWVRIVGSAPQDAEGVKMAQEERQTSHVRVATASLIGTAIEWYDFFLYGTAAALIFNKLFFPTFDPMVGTLLAFTTYALGFVARPLGGLVFGHYGDRIGRKTMLYLTLLIMGGDGDHWHLADL